MCLQNPSAVLNLSGGVIKWGENPLKRRGRVEPTAFFRGESESGRTIPQSAALPLFAQGAHGLAAAASRPLSLFPLIRGCTPLYASPYGKGRCHGVTEGIRKSVFDMANRNAGINPQKGRHLLCTFCPCEKRKQGETSGNAARDKPAVSRRRVEGRSPV